jgi:hypothetical protein
MRRLGAERDAAPAGAGRTYPCALGRLEVTVRPHYGGLPLRSAGRGTGEREKSRGSRTCGSWPSPRKNGPSAKNRRGGAPRGVPLRAGDPERMLRPLPLRRALRRSAAPHLCRGVGFQQNSGFSGRESGFARLLQAIHSDPSRLLR